MVSVGVATCALLLPASAQGQRRVWDYAYHDAGTIGVQLDNTGQWMEAIYPADYTPMNPLWRCRYMEWLGFNFGCIRRGLDTLVSDAMNFGSSLPIDRASNVTSSADFDPRARASQQHYTVYTDTGVMGWSPDFIEGSGYRGIGIEVHQTSYADSTYVARNFIVVDAWIVNVSADSIVSGCVGIDVTPRVHNVWFAILGKRTGRSLCGFLETVPGQAAGIVDTIDLVWAADNDGDAATSNYVYGINNATAVFGWRILRAPPGGKISFNWSAWNGWGPSRHDTPRESRAPGFNGTPYGDRNLYKRLTNHEIDYDQAFSAIDFTAQGWNPPDGGEGAYIAGGTEIDFFLSVGPLDVIPPGDSVPFTYAIIAGEGFHTDPYNYDQNFRPDNPGPYLDRLDFSNLLTSARSAEWFFDTPGIDTDGDGDRGEYYVVGCDPAGLSGCDTIYYRGDGVPDFRTPGDPPPRPAVTLRTAPNTVVLRWSGALTECARDPFSGQRDFEGYRVYASSLPQSDRFALVASWDREDFKRFSYRSATQDWRQTSDPLTIDEWREELADPGFDPSAHQYPSFATAYRDTSVDTIRTVQGVIIDIVAQERYSYFVREDGNNTNRFQAGGEEVVNHIQQVALHDTVVAGRACTYGEYEFTLDNLLASKPLYFSVTAFDWGDHSRGVAPTESRIGADSVFAFPLYSADAVVDSGLKVSVYPNPYKIRFQDAYGRTTSYYAQGYEAPGKSEMTERDRRIWFINLPDTATIRIWSLDGDLIREIYHPDKFLTTYSSVVGWDLVSRNTQAVTSGIYLWQVDSRLGRQIGKLVIIK